jgi:hypothetical protein
MVPMVDIPNALSRSELGRRLASQRAESMLVVQLTALLVRPGRSF